MSANLNVTRPNAKKKVLMVVANPSVMDGWDAVRTIKGDAALRHIPIIGLSAHAMSGYREKALAAGCNDYLTKPLDEDLLIEKLQAYAEGG